MKLFSYFNGILCMPLFISLLTIFFVDHAHCGISKITVEDKGLYSKIVINLDKTHKYTLNKKGNESLVIQFDELAEPKIDIKNFKSNLVRSIEQKKKAHY